MLLPIGMAIFALGLIGLIFGIFQKMKAGRLIDAPLATTGDVANRGRAVAGPKGQISAQGNVMCQQPVYAPFSGLPCLFYEIKCTAKWKSGDTNHTKVIDEQKVAAQFAIDDGTGPVWIDAHEGGDFDPTQTKSETKGTGLIGGLTGTDLQFGNYRVNTPMLDVGTKYEVSEEILPCVPRLYVCGKLADSGNMISAPSWRVLIMSGRSRDELLASATKTAKIALIVGGLGLVSGGAMAGVGQFVLAKSDDAPVAATSASASASVSAFPPPTPIPVAVPPPGTLFPPSSAAAAAPSASAAKGKGKGKGKKR